MNITIIGGGFSGAMLAVNLIRKYPADLTINIIDENGFFGRGIAYSPYSRKQILNVIAGKMSALPGDPDHFLKWLSQNEEYKDIDKSLLSQAFLPRVIYGKYLDTVWREVLDNLPANIKVKQFHKSVVDVSFSGSVKVTLDDDQVLNSDYCVFATGNTLPRNPSLKSNSFFNSSSYFKNPWNIESVSNVNNALPVLIIGNGLTMVDTVIGLRENGFNNKIYSISPNGFKILPHRHSTIQYTGLTKDLADSSRLADIARMVFKHKKIVRAFGITAEPLIDSLRPLTQKIWKGFTAEEKRIFMSRFRHLWGVARHRIPLHIYDMIQDLKQEGLLKIVSGSLYEIEEDSTGIYVTYQNRKSKVREQIHVQRVINCTGPDSDICSLKYLNGLISNGTITQDDLKLGMETDPETFETIDVNGNRNPNLFAIGSLLKGKLWESTAVNELRVQANDLAELFVKKSKVKDGKQYI